MRIRRGARAVVLDPEGRLLMLRVRNDGVIEVPGAPTPAAFWILPGGGVEAGESFIEAARREVLEETGLTGLDWGSCLWVRELEARWAGEVYRAQERFFLARTGAGRGPLRLEAEASGYRWWSVAELGAAEGVETFYPPGLAGLLGEVVDGRLPREPVVLTR
ncbi:NUDIX domain-containing protein [Nonomuraea sp. NPDC050310]|uniref:NUDIX hydrolase n=1 Tax=Nonomuraea sp. NPDC050310 TaxID=3154935 RepID=UPI0033E6406A